MSLLPLGSALNSSAKAATLAAAPAAKGGFLSQNDSTGAAIGLLCVLNARGPAKLKQGAKLGAPAKNDAALLSVDCSAKDDTGWMRWQTWRKAAGRRFSMRRARWEHWDCETA